MSSPHATFIKRALMLLHCTGASMKILLEEKKIHIYRCMRILQEMNSSLKHATMPTNQVNPHVAQLSTALPDHWCLLQSICKVWQERHAKHCGTWANELLQHEVWVGTSSQLTFLGLKTTLKTGSLTQCLHNQALLLRKQCAEVQMCC